MSTDGDHAPDESEEPEEPAGTRGPRAAFAVNWKIVLFVDALMGLVVVVAGLIALVAWNFWL
ncbi:MAG: hypothetical protein ACXWB2_03120, partial [Acidimicrobiales bacterium]